METIAKENTSERNREDKMIPKKIKWGLTECSPAYNNRFLVEFPKELGLESLHVIGVSKPILRVHSIVVPKDDDYDTEIQDLDPEEDPDLSPKASEKQHFLQVTTWEPMEIQLMEMVDAPNTKIIVDFIEHSKNCFARKPMFTTVVHTLNAVGEVVLSWKVYGMITSVDFGALRYTDDRTQLIRIDITPDYCEIITPDN